MKTTDLNTVISVVKVNRKEFITVAMTSDSSNVTSLYYPLEKGKDSVNCGGTGYKDIVSVRPATDEEITLWRNAEGIGKSARKAAGTADKVKNIKWVKVGLMDKKIITNL